MHIILLTLQNLAITMSTKKCEENRICFESVDLKKNVRRLRSSYFKKPGILFTEQQKILHTNF